MDAFIESLTTNELRKILQFRGLSISYRLKVDLVKRLKTSLLETDTEELFRNILVEDDDDDKFEDSLEMASNFTFKDVEDALEVFTGETTKTVDEWVKHYEEVAKTCGWNEIQMYLFARKLLRGAARGAVEADEKAIDYKKLVAALKKEFDKERSSYEIHRDLMRRKKLASESHLVYFYAMKKIGAKVDQPSMVRYIVDGLPEEKAEKSILYDATDLDELKVKLKVYESMHRDKSSSTVIRCKNCGSKSHLTDSCPDQQKGKRCFKCNNFGHVAKDCSSDGSNGKEKWVKTISGVSQASESKWRIVDDKHVKMAQGIYEEK